MRRFKLIFNTIIHLRFIQIRYQLWYRIRKMWRVTVGFKYPLFIEKKSFTLNLTAWIEKTATFNNHSFTFLNLPKTFENKTINWNFAEHGKLWTYNLNYMDFLLQPQMDVETGFELIKNYIQNLTQQSDGLEPYPTALRGINWIKFLSKHSHHKDKINNFIDIDKCLYAQYQILLDNLEYHLMGNHLLENGFSLLFAAFYFNDNLFYKKSKAIIETELEEQILHDGAHFELSPMYHQIILDRLLDCINLVQNNKSFKKQEALLKLMQNKAKGMLNWLNNITFSNGRIPLFNDSAPDIAPTTRQLNDYAKRLVLCKMHSNSLNLCSSGYRRFNGVNYECIIDIAGINPLYQPGHAHADTFNFVLNVNNKQILIDTGTSTYEANNRRTEERGTAAHNTVTIKDTNSSEIWSSFRVAKRAHVKLIKDDVQKISASHDGYRAYGTTHQREWTFANKRIIIKDDLIGKNIIGKAHFHVAPGMNPILSENRIEIDRTGISFSFSTNESLKLIKKTEISSGYNQFSSHYKIEVQFKKELQTMISVA